MTGFRTAALLAALLAPLPSGAQQADPAASIRSVTPTIRDLVATVQDLGAEGRDISTEAQEMLARSGDIQLRKSGEDYVLSVASDVLFGFDSADLSDQAQRSLGDVAELIQRKDAGQVRVLGHTDAKGTEAYNLTLSNRRAMAVADFLRGKGVAADRLLTEGRGEAEPVAPNQIEGQDNHEGRAQNRRVEFIVPAAMLN